jgi:hypothetical protein
LQLLQEARGSFAEQKPGTVSDALAVKDVAKSARNQGFNAVVFGAQGFEPKWKGDDIHIEEDAEGTET